MPWLYLFAAGLCEVVWPLGFKYSAGFTRNWPIVAATFLVMLTSFGLMAMASRTLPVGTVYAVWTGMGTIGVALIGMLLFGEPRTAGRLAFLSLIVIGVIGLRFLEGSGAPKSITP